MKIAISAESTVDLSKELLDNYNISTIPFNILLGEKLGVDGEISAPEIFDYVKKSGELPKTSAINEEQYYEYFHELLKNHDAIIHFTLSSELSCACDNAKKAGKRLENVFVVDSQSLSTGIALLAIYARKLAENGISPEEIAQRCELRVPFVQASFVLEKLNFLYKGGRCNSLQLLGANLLKLRPQIVVKNGKMQSGKKYRGNFLKCVSNYCDDILEEFNNPDLELAFVTYSSATDDAIDLAINKLKEKGFSNIFCTKASSTISSHCGENCLGILYINKPE